MSKKLLTRVSLYVICWALGLLVIWTLLKVYSLQQTHKDTVDKIVGLKRLDPKDELFEPLIASLEKKLSPTAEQTLTSNGNEPKDEDDYNETYVKAESTIRATAGHWIPYQGTVPSKVDYGWVNFTKSDDGQNADVKSEPSAGSAPANQQAQRPGRPNDIVDRYVFDVMLQDVIKRCAGVNDYQQYSDVVWDTFFEGKKNKYLAVGKVYVASEDHIAIFPYRAKPYKLKITDRDWWKAAYGSGDPQRRPSDDYYDMLNEKQNAGLSVIYPDIVAGEGLTDLTRTVWFKFKKYDRDFLLGVDLRLSDFALNIFDEIRYESIGLLALCLLLPFAIYAHSGQKGYAADGAIERIYKLIRVDRERVDYNAGQPKMSEFSSTMSIRNVRENRLVSQSSWQFQLNTQMLKASKLIDRSKVQISSNTDLTEVTVKKTFDLSLKTGNLKAVELWKVCPPNNDSLVLGVIEVLWQNNRNTNDITLNQVYWDSNTSASYTDILKDLKRHLQASESTSFIVDQTSVPESEPDIVNNLKNNLDYVKDFATKFESFNNRVLLFDNNVPVLKEIYSNTNFTFFATCSIEFLDNLQRQGEVKEILGSKVDVRYIIDGERRKFTDFYNGLSEDLQEFIRLLPNLKIIEYKPSLETIYLNRDFCIMSFGQDKCVLYTDMSDERAQKGWISWRAVDIDYYTAIKNFIESGDVQKTSINFYLEKK